jgi:tetratricopeptide (TPR) repeat protein
MIEPGGNFSSFSTLLKTFRKRQRLTQHMLAEAIGIHRSTLIHWEQGNYLPQSKALILELARHLKLDEQETRQLLEASLTALSPYWSVPFPRNPYFTGREEILEVLHAQLSGDQAVALTQSSALQGLGGVGKTQIVLEYAYRHALDYSAVFWIAAETEEQANASLLRVGHVLHLPEREEKDQQQVIAAVQRWLSAHGQWLLIWDNVEDLDLFRRFLPAIRSGAILLTTRSPTLGTLARGLELAPMEQEEGILFLLRRAKVLSSEATREQVYQLATQVPAQYAAASELVTVLGGLPLALDQAGAYLEETQCGVSAYLDLFRTRRVTLLQRRGEGAYEHPASVSTTFTLAITTVARRHPAALDLLHVCALLQPDAIPEELFRQGGKHLGARVEAACCDPLEWDHVVSIACAYSLLARQPEEQTLSLHRLVQAVLLDTMGEAERKRWSTQVIEALDAIFPEIRPTTEYALRKLCNRILSHALHCLLPAESSEESLAFASLTSKAAHALDERGQYAEAESLYLRALQVREQALGPNHLQVASSLHYLALLYWKQGKYIKAEPLNLRALQIREQVLGPDHLEVAGSLNNLALLYWMQGRYTEAEAFYLRALQIWKQAQDPNHPELANVLHNLANLYFMQGKYTEVEPLWLRALQIREQVLGPVHPETTMSLNNLAALYFEQGKYTEAEPLWLRALHIREQTQGPAHPDVAFPLNNLANLYFMQGKYTEVEPFYLRALSIWEQALGLDHPYLAEPLTGLADLYREQGQYQKAESFYHRALSIREQHLGQHHPQTAQTLHDLARFRQQQGKLDEARSLAERALSIRSQVLGDDHPQTVATRALCTHLVQEQEGCELHPPLILSMNVAVQGGTEQIAYTRTVRMREVTFTCTICGQTVTQLHYPSGRLKYCSEECRAIGATQREEIRVARQREKRQSAREGRLRSQQEENA